MSGSADARLIAAVGRADVVARYWKKVAPDPGTPDACWLWTGAISGKGHGRFWVADGHVVIAHRFGWALAHPGQPMPEVVSHRCDNPVCQNPGPGHMEASTNADNRAEWAARRHNPGSALRDTRGGRGRARAIRDAARDGADITAAMDAGLTELDRNQDTLW